MRKIHVAFWNAEQRVFSAYKAQLELLLKKIYSVDIMWINSLEAVEDNPLDLLITIPPPLSNQGNEQWLRGVMKSMTQTVRIWTPALVISDMSFDDQNRIMKDAIDSNWYFDLVHPEQLESIPIRVSNLIRIHDHLRELYSYRNSIHELEEKVEALEANLRDGG